MLGAATIGNATLIVYDGEPVLATDPWLDHPDGAYFGSWALEHEIPVEQEQDVLRAPAIWLSHGHPDHLHPQTLARLKGKRLLLPDHVGGRIRDDLAREGHQVSVLPDGEWVRISRRVRVMCITNYIQDAILLVDVNGTLFLDLNDAASTRPSPRAGAKGCFGRVRRIVQGFESAYLLRLSGFGDADMINLFDESGRRIGLPDTTRRIGRDLSDYARAIGATHVIPFSSFHRYQRSDSAWANAYRPPLDGYRDGFREEHADYIDPFCFVDAGSGLAISLVTRPLHGELRKPEEFGDCWSDELDDADWRLVEAYFRRKELVRRDFGFLTFVVGGKERTLRLEGDERVGIRFEVPRGSLVEAVRHEVFDNLLLGNFMRATLYGMPSLYSPNFVYAVAKYADNGRAETAREVSRYLGEYARRAGPELRAHLFERGLSDWVARHFARTPLYAAARRAYRAVRS